MVDQQVIAIMASIIYSLDGRYKYGEEEVAIKSAIEVAEKLFKNIVKQGE